RAELRAAREGERETGIWSDTPRSGWQLVRRTAPAVPEEVTTFRLGSLAGGQFESVAEASLRWHLPALFVDGRRVPPGQHFLPETGRIILVSSEGQTNGGPSVEGGELRKLRREGVAWVHEIQVRSERSLRVVAGGARWQFNARTMAVVRLRLLAGSDSG